jgi:hypothetical protein
VKCPRPEELDFYLEGDMDGDSVRELEKHLETHPACRARVEDRKAFLEALRGLPDIEIPADFTARVMAAVFPARRSAFAWLAALIGGMSGLFLGGLAYILITGQNLPGLALEAGKSFWGSGRNGIVILAKVGKLAALSLQLMIQLGSGLVEKLGRVGSLVDSRIYIALGVVIVAFPALLYLVLKRRTLNGEKP